MTTQHLDDKLLQLFVAGHLEYGQEEIIEGHLARCPECAKRVSVLERAPEDKLFQNVKAAAASEDVFFGSHRLIPGIFLNGTLRLEEKLGRGGMGEAWKAFDTFTERHVVLKFLTGETQHLKEAMKSVRSSFQKIHALQHQHICPAYSLFQDERYGLCLVMKFIDGMSLHAYKRRRIEEIGKMSFLDTVRILWDIADGLDYAHEKKVIHRDIKPQNVMIGDRDGVQIIDFGLAEEIRTQMAKFSQVVMDVAGTRPYMAPEQWKGHFQDARTDQYALAATAYELFAGHPPFQGNDAAILRECVLHDEPEPIAGFSEPINAALGKALSKRREERFPDCKSFVKALVEKSKNGEKFHFAPSLPPRPSMETTMIVTAETLRHEPVRRPDGRKIGRDAAFVGVGVVLGGFLSLFLGSFLGNFFPGRFFPGESPSPQPNVAVVGSVDTSTSSDQQEEPKSLHAFSLSPDLTKEETERLRRVRERLASIPEAQMKVELSPSISGVVGTGIGLFTADGRTFFASAKPTGNYIAYDFAAKESTVSKTTISYKYLSSLTADSNGRVVAVMEDRGGKYVVWDIKAGKILHTLEKPDQGNAMFLISPDGSLLVAGSTQGTVVIRDMATGEERRRFRGLPSEITSMDISRDGSLLAVGTGKEARLWQLETGREWCRMNGHANEPVSVVAFNPQGTILATGSADQTVVFWDVKTGRPVKRLVGCESGVTALGFSPDGSQLVVGFSNSFYTSVWNVETGMPLYRLPLCRDHPARLATFSGNGKMISTGANIPIVIWDAPTQEETARLEQNEKEKRETAKEILLREMPPPEHSQVGVSVWHWGTFYSEQEEEFENSLYARAFSKYTFRLDKNWKTFKAHYGLQEGTDLDEANCVFIVKGDNKELFRSEPVQDGSVRPLEVDVRNVMFLELIVDPNGPRHWDEAVWFTPMLGR